MLTRQEVFDKVSKHLLTQNKKALIPTEEMGISCRYRGENNTKCAIGCLIPDELYLPNIEGTGVYGLSTEFLEKCGLDMSGGVSFYADLQNIHDGHNVENWENRLKFIASKYQLTFNK